jgi:hypothetical protein
MPANDFAEDTVGRIIANIHAARDAAWKQADRPQPK